uniref:Cytochrome P450 n=1 Tax=Plectus sambesii TaxID=2011161 RepID=A0A914XQM6_9BILA
MIVELVLAVVIFGFVYFIRSRSEALKQRDRMGIGGPRPMLILGNMVEMGTMMAKNGQQLYRIFDEWKKKYGKLYGFYCGPRLFVVVEKLDMAREILIKKFDCFTDRMEMSFLSGALSESIVNAKGADWKDTRRCLTPTFSLAKMRKMSLSIDDKLSIFLEKIERLASTGACFDIYDHFKALTLDVIAQCAFAMDTDCQNNPNDLFLVHGRNYFDQMPSPERNVLMQLS